MYVILHTQCKQKTCSGVTHTNRAGAHSTPKPKPLSVLPINTSRVCEIKCQLDATEVFIADLIACSTCFGHHYAHHQELKSIIQWLLPVVFRAVVFKLLVWFEAEGYVSGLQDVVKHNPQLHARPAT